METIPILFNLTIESLRRIGARGGKAHARNWRARQQATLQDAPLSSLPVAVVPRGTTAQAIARLDAQFAWLRNAGRPANRRQ